MAEFWKLSAESGGGDRGVTISRFPLPVLPPPVFFFLSLCLPTFIVFLPLSCKSRCLTPYSNRECFGLVQNKKLCCKSNYFALSSAIIEAAFLRHKFTPRSRSVFCGLQLYGGSSQEGLPWTDFSPPHRKIPRPIKMVFEDILPDSLCFSYGEFRQLAGQTRHWHDWHSRHTCTCVMPSYSCPMIKATWKSFQFHGK